MNYRKPLPNKPEGWQWFRMDEVAKLETGHTPSRYNPEYWGGEFYWVSIRDVDENTKYIGHTKETINQLGIDNSNARVLPEGTVLFSRGPTIGKVCILSRPMTTNQSFVGWIPSDKLDSLFLYYLLKHSTNHLSSIGAGATMNTIYMRDIETLHICLPDIGEQKRIAAILEKADEIAQTVSKTQEMNEEYWRIIFQSNVTAPLERWPISRKQHDCPAGWKWARLVDVARLESGHTPSRNRSEWWDGDISWITLGDIRKHDGKIIYETEENTNQLGLENSSARLLPERTVCFARTASVGFATIMGKEMATSQDFVNFVCGSEILPEYLLYSFLSSREWLLSIANGSTHKTIYYPVVKSLYIAIPPLNIQEIFTHLFNHQQQSTESMEERLTLTDLLRLASASELLSTNNSLSVAQEMLI